MRRHARQAARQARSAAHKPKTTEGTVSAMIIPITRAIADTASGLFMAKTPERRCSAAVPPRFFQTWPPARFIFIIATPLVPEASRTFSMSRDRVNPRLSQNLRPRVFCSETDTITAEQPLD